MAVKFRRKQGLGDDISTASMSDIAFLLLIFFLVSTIFAEEFGLIMQLPGAASDVAKVKMTNILNVEILASNLILLAGEPFPVSGLENEIRQRIAANQDLIVQVKIHPDSFYGTMVDVIDELHQADAKKISLKGMDVVE